MPRRMFSSDIVSSDAFLEMPVSTQSLYFQLGVNADDDGFISSPKIIMKILGSSEDDLKILLAKKFLLKFENGIFVIKHWRINNQIRKDRYRESKYIREKELLFIRENGSYSFNQENALPLPRGYYSIEQLDLEFGNQVATNGCRSIGKVSIGKVSIDKISNTQTKFVKPTPEEIKSYCLERKNKVDPDRFYDFYESKGWKVGKNPMKDWKACIRTWEKNDTNNTPKNVLHTGEDIISKIKLKN